MKWEWLKEIVANHIGLFQMCFMLYFFVKFARTEGGMVGEPNDGVLYFEIVVCGVFVVLIMERTVRDWISAVKWARKRIGK